MCCTSTTPTRTSTCGRTSWSARPAGLPTSTLSRRSTRSCLLSSTPRSTRRSRCPHAPHNAPVLTNERVAKIDQLHRVLKVHLDHEERVGVPLMLEHMTTEMIRADARKAETEIGRYRMPVVFGWLASCLDDEQLAVAVQQQPRLVRTLFRWFWWPSYERRLRQLYAGVDLDALSPREGVLR